MQLEITTTPEGVPIIRSLGIGELKFEQMRVFRQVPSGDLTKQKK